jgi:hypothetical protein
MNLRLIGILILLTMLSVTSGASGLEPISVRLLVPNPRACVGQQTLSLEAVLTNNTKKTIEISGDGVSHIIAVTKYKDGKSVGFRNFLREIKPVKWVRIAPHQSVIVPSTEPIGPNAPFVGSLFTESGTFAIMIEFAILQRNPDGNAHLPNEARSNEAMFMIGDCSDESGDIAPTSKSVQPPEFSTTGVVTTKPSKDTLLHESGHANPPKQ